MEERELSGICLNKRKYVFVTLLKRENIFNFACVSWALKYNNIKVN